jgi:hypothetical protein
MFRQFSFKKTKRGNPYIEDGSRAEFRTRDLSNLDECPPQCGDVHPQKRMQHYGITQQQQTVY